ncbi:MAG TPA: glycosyltransferase family 2 protein [Chitinophagaceae bacterium]|nr:glycosyltransferase family 2 protein [Chitinophagaceae bacterium]
MLKQPLVAIVVLNYNGRDYLRKFLPFVLASSYINKKIFLIDNASTDDSIREVTNNFPAVQVIALDSNYGFAEGYNKGLQKIEADYYVLLNSDVEVTPGWIEPVITLMETDAAIAACQPKILAYNNREQFEYAGAGGGWIDTLGYPFSRGRVFETIEEDRGQYDDTAAIFWASGAAMFVRTAVYKQLGGLDGYFFAHMEEIDLCWRIQRAGYKIMCCPQSIVYHIGGGTLPKGNMRKVFLNFRNNLIMMAKNLPWYALLLKLPARITLDYIFAFKNLLHGQAAPCRAVIKAHYALFVWMFTAKKSRLLLPKKPLKRLDGVCGRSIVWHYFVKHKNTFSEIVNNKLG